MWRGNDPTLTACKSWPGTTNSDERCREAARWLSVMMAVSVNADGTPEYPSVASVVGQCKAVGHDQVLGLISCNPGALTVSSMTCQSHDYNAEMYKHAATSCKTQCKVISLKCTVALCCLGSYSMNCQSSGTFKGIWIIRVNSCEEK